MIASRTPAARAPLTPDRIIDVAMDLAGQYGNAGLSMRRLAAELGVEAMSIYYHVPNKATLTSLMADRSLSQVQAPDAALAWDQQLLQLILGLFQAGMDNPTVTQALAIELPSQDAGQGNASAAATVVAQIMQLLHHSPLPKTQQRSAGNGLIKLVIGAIVAQPPQPVPPTIRTRVTDRRRPPSRDPQPALVASAKYTRTQKEAIAELQRNAQWFLLGIRTAAPPDGKRISTHEASSTTKMAHKRR